MINDLLYSINNLKHKANRGLSTKEGYQWYDIDIKNKILIPHTNTKLDIKRKFIEPFVSSRFKNKSIIDLGCDKGYFSWLCMRSGASTVVANDVNQKLYDYLVFLCKTMKWKNIIPLNKNLFEEKNVPRFDYVLSLAMLHQVENLDLEEIIKKIRLMSKEGSIIEFCEDYQYKFGENWNNDFFNNIILKYYSSINLLGKYQAIAEKGGTRYIYDCRCN
jgi:2-polyprenyl-3-methyl-5-hydroxy-6-metoxy-1,4-benzoquinol methylase